MASSGFVPDRLNQPGAWQPSDKKRKKKVDW